MASDRDRRENGDGENGDGAQPAVVEEHGRGTTLDHDVKADEFNAASDLSMHALILAVDLRGGSWRNRVRFGDLGEARAARDLRSSEAVEDELEVRLR